MKKVKFPRRVVNSLDFLSMNSSHVLSKTLSVKLLLQTDKDERLLLLNNSIRSTISELTLRMDDSMKNAFIQMYNSRKDSKNFVDKFKEILYDGLETIPTNVNQFIEAINEIIEINDVEDSSQMDMAYSKDQSYSQAVKLVESILSSSQNSNFHAINHEALVGMPKILKIPKMKTIIVIFGFLHYLDYLYKNIDAVKNNRPFVTSISKENNSTQIITKRFDELNSKLGNNKSPFLNENDYNFYVDLLTLYFEGNEYKLPERKIELTPGIKGKVASTLGNIHRRFTQTYKADEAFHDVVRVLKPFECDLEYEKIYRAMRNK
ncbi:MAG: hypothetical protein ACQETL_20210 [Bacteroidota bacterium]